MEERELASYGLTEEEARIRRQQGKGNVVSDSGGKSNKQIENLVYRAKLSLKSELEKEGFVYEDL